MLYAHEMILNELARGLRPTAEGVEWFEGLMLTKWSFGMEALPAYELSKWFPVVSRRIGPGSDTAPSDP